MSILKTKYVIKKNIFGREEIKPQEDCWTKWQSTLITGRKFTSYLTDLLLNHFCSYQLLCSFSPPVPTTWTVVFLLFMAWLIPAVFRHWVVSTSSALFPTSLNLPLASWAAPAAVSHDNCHIAFKTFNFIIRTGLIGSLCVPWGP